MSKEIVARKGSFITKTLSAIVITCALTAIHTAPAAAQSVSSLNCKDCVKSRHIKNGKIKGKDLKDSSVETDKIGDGAVTGSKIEDGAISMSKLGNNVTLMGMSGIASVPPSAFVPLEAYPNYQNAEGLAISNNAGPQYCASAAISLPDGAVVNEVEAYVFDNSNTGNLQIALLSFEPSDPKSTAVVMTLLESSGSSLAVNAISTTSITDPTVDLATRFYHLLACLPKDTALTGARVYY